MIEILNYLPLLGIAVICNILCGIYYSINMKEISFDWNKLFWSCGHCNGIKNQRKYDEHIIGCCKVDPEDRIYKAVIFEYTR